MLPVVYTLFPGEWPLYQDDKAPTLADKIIQKWFPEHEEEVGYLALPFSVS